VKASIASKNKTSPYRLEVNHTRRGVFFDRVDTTGGGERTLMIHTSPRRARLMAKWILDNIHPED
jgi:hypothetical protein